MPSLSLIVIARDEARCIERCLRSAAACVDEMWVLDTGSVDDTPARPGAAARRCGTGPGATTLPRRAMPHWR